MTTYLTYDSEITLFRTRQGKSVHIQYGVIFKDLFGETPTQEELTEQGESMVGWIWAERRKGICGAYSQMGFLDPDRGSTGWCEDNELCATCMVKLDDEQRVLVFEYLNQGAPPREEDGYE